MKVVVVSYQAAAYNYRSKLCLLYFISLYKSHKYNDMQNYGSYNICYFSLILILPFRHYLDIFILFSGVSRTYCGLRKEFAFSSRLLRPTVHTCAQDQNVNQFHE